MATISAFLFWRHLRAEPNQYILHFRRGRLVRQGVGLAYWFNPLSASLAQVPVEDCETTFLLQERSADFQQVAVQCTVVYRFVDPKLAAARVNFTISPETGRWVEKPMDRMAALWSELVRQPARAYLSGVPVVQAVREGPEAIRRAIADSLAREGELATMGLAVAGVQVSRVAPTAELEKALETPTREALQEKADEATFQRRALAVEKERAIKENELATEIELARRQDDLIRRKGENKLLEVQSQAAAERARVEAELARQAMVAEGYARDVRAKSQGDADARRSIGEAEAEMEAKRVEMWRGVPAEVLVGLALQAAAGKLENINHLNITPEILGEGLQRLLRRQGEK